MKHYISLIIAFAFCADLSAQGLPVVTVPDPRKKMYTFPQNRTNPHNPINEIGARNATIIREVEEHQREIAIAQRQADIKMLTEKGFPSQSYQQNTSYYYDAFEEINNMLKGDIPLNLGRAVFLVENAFENNSIDYTDYKTAIKKKVEFCNLKIQEENLDPNDDLVKKMMLFRLLSDTLKVKTKNKELTHYPIQYNYNDYNSKQNYNSHFVTKLMQTGTGQCHSMPLFYLILAEEIETDAYWAFSPKHSFVKIQDDKGAWCNLELTCKVILSDVHYMNNSYIKAEAIRNRIYLEPLDKTNIVAEMLIELARGYFQKFGLDDFYLHCLDTAMQYLNNDLNALMLKASYQTRLTLTLADLLGVTTLEAMKEISPEAYKHHELTESLYEQIDNMGYEELPESLYVRWLDYVDKEKNKLEELPSIFIKTPKK